MYGEGPLHIACLHDRPANVEQLLRWGAKPSLTMSGRFPIHCAMKVASARYILPEGTLWKTQQDSTDIYI